MTAILPVRVDIATHCLFVNDRKMIIAVANKDNQRIFHKIYSPTEWIKGPASMNHVRRPRGPSALARPMLPVAAVTTGLRALSLLMSVQLPISSIL
jgi:hypothetical protein